MLATNLTFRSIAVLHIATFVGLLLSFAVAEPDHVIFYIRRGGTQCFTISAPANDKLTGEVRVTNGAGDMPIGFWVLVGPTNDVLHSKSDVEHEKFTVLAPRGPHHGHDNVSTPSEYKLCIYHRGPLGGGSVDDVRKVFITFDASADPDAEDDFGQSAKVLKGVALQSDVNEIRAVISKIEESMLGVTEEIDTIRDREQALFDISSGVAQQIWVMGAVSCLAIAAAGFFQLHQTHGELKFHGSKVLADGSQGVSRENSRGMSRRGSSIQLRRSLGSIGRLASFTESRKEVLPSHTSLSHGPSLKKVQSEKSMSRSRSVA